MHKLQKWNDHNRKNRYMRAYVVLKSQVISVLAEMKKNKATEPDEVVMEMLKIIDNFMIDKVIKMISYIYWKITIDLFPWYCQRN